MSGLAERFGKKLEELCRERGALKLGLPSRQPSVALFLEQLRQVVHGALQRADCGQCRSVTQQTANDLTVPSSPPCNNKDITALTQYCFVLLTFKDPNGLVFN